MRFSSYSALTARMVPVAPMGIVYVVGAVVAGALFVTEAHRLLRAAKAGAGAAVLRPMRLFHWSNSYLALVFVAVAVDPLLF